MKKKISKIKPFRFIIVVVILLQLSFYGCVLTGSQVKVTKNYYSSLKDVDNYCRTLIESSAKVEFERRLLYPESYSNDSVMVDELIKNYQKFSVQDSFSDRLIQNVNELGGYLNSFSFLLSGQKSNTQVNDHKVLAAIEDFSSYLPFGIGLTVYKTVYDVVNYTVRFFRIPHSRKKMKEYILKGQEFIPENEQYITQKLKKISVNLENEKKLIKENYLKLMSEQKENKGPINYYLNYNPIFLKKFDLASETKELSEDLIILLPVISRTYSDLRTEMMERKRLKSEMPGMPDLYKSLSNSKKHFAHVCGLLNNNKSQ